MSCCISVVIEFGYSSNDSFRRDIHLENEFEFDCNLKNLLEVLCMSGPPLGRRGGD